jgi:hypothetical protein
MVDFVRQKPLGQVPMTMAQAKEWMENFLPRFKEGGVWGIPRAGSIYRIEGSRKTVVRIEGETVMSFYRQNPSFQGGGTL